MKSNIHRNNMPVTCVRAFDIAKKALEKCVTPVGIVAGQHHFVDVWARDSLFATFGANINGLSQASVKTIELFLANQRQDGLIPYRIKRSPTTILKYFGRPRYFPNPRANFRSRQSGGIVLDGGLMTVISARQYWGTKKDNAFLQKISSKLNTIMEWYLNRFGTNLLREWYLCEWADAVLKSGNTLYTNILWWKALVSMEQLSEAVGDKKGEILYQKASKEVKGKIKKAFWNGEFFSDWIDWKRHDFFASGSNLLSIVWGMTNRSEANSILSTAWRRCWNGWTLATNWPKYPKWRIPFWSYLFGMSDYHNRGCIWLQPGLLFAIALNRIGEGRYAFSVLDKISQVISRNKEVYEIYDNSGSPISRLLYKSERPFAWSAGLYLWAFSELVSNSKGLK